MINPDNTPLYPSIPAAAKFRRDPNANMYAYGETVLHAIRQMQRQTLSRASTYVAPCPCASGTWESDGHKILEAIRKQHRTGK